MSEEQTKIEVPAVTAEVKVEDGVLVMQAKADLVDLVYEGTHKVNPEAALFVRGILESVRDNLDWKGKATEML